MKFEQRQSSQKNPQSIKVAQGVDLADKKEDSLLGKDDRFERVSLTEEEKNMTRVELAKKYNLGKFGVSDAIKKGYVVLNSYKSKIRDNEIIDTRVEKDRFNRVPLSEEEKSISIVELASKYDVSYMAAYQYKKDGFINVKNPSYVNKGELLSQIKEKNKSFLEEVVPININSIETVLNNPEEQKILKEVVDSFSSYRHNDKFKINQKKFKLLNGKEVFFSDLVTLSQIFELKLSRNEKGELFAFYKDKNIKFSPNMLSNSHGGFTFKDIKQKDSDSNEIKKSMNSSSSLESFAPEVFKSGFFKEEDFDKRLAGSMAYEIYGPHERVLSHNYPYVFFSNSEGKCKYFLGRDKFVGTDKKINHDTVRVTLLDNNNAAITDIIHGRKVVLYTFPLIKKEEYEKKKKEVDDKFKGKEEAKINYSQHIDVGGKEMVTKLVPYMATSYIQKNKNESDVDYAERVSRLSDLSYILGNFRSFLSETGLAANNYLWGEQLVLADALTSVEQKDKIVNFGKNFKKDGLRTFLSVEQGGKEMGNKILTLGEKLPEEIAQKVFTKYGEIIDVADKAEEEVKKLYEKENIPNNIFVSIKETLLKKGAELLSGLSDGLNGNKNIEGEEIAKKLEDIKTSTIIMGQSYIELYKQGINIPIEDIKNTTLEKISAQNLTNKEKEELLKVYENGRPKETYENEKHIKLLKDEFEETLNNKDTFVFNIRFNGEVVAFATFNKVNEDTLHIGGLTFIDDIRNPAIGAAVMNSIMNEFGDFNIEALVHSENKILAMYQKRFGFKIKKELPREENAGELYYEIERPKNIKIEKRDNLEEAA